MKPFKDGVTYVSEYIQPLHLWDRLKWKTSHSIILKQCIQMFPPCSMLQFLHRDESYLPDTLPRQPEPGEYDFHARIRTSKSKKKKKKICKLSWLCCAHGMGRLYMQSNFKPFSGKQTDFLKEKTVSKQNWL